MPKKPGDQPKNQTSDLAGAFAGFRGAILAVSVISGIINLLTLTGSLYMLQVYDRVLASHSVPTLVSLSVLMFVLYAFYGVFDLLRNQASGRAAVLFDRRVAGSVQAMAVNLPLKGASRSTAQQPVRDVDTIRTFLASGGPVAFLDLPWMPLYLAVVFLLHPLLGVMCLAGVLLLVLLTFLSELLSRHEVRASARADAARKAIADANARNAETLQAMGFVGRAVHRFERANQSYLTLQVKASDVTSKLAAVSKFLRLTLQSAILGLGAYLTIRGEVTGGAIIAASITTSRAMAPVEQVIAHWRNFLAARHSFDRLSKMLDRFTVAAPSLALPPPVERLTLANATVCVPGTQRPVLCDVGFELRSGQALAIIGPSAAGKSSLARAITGVWPLLHGSVRLDGAELDGWTSDELGKHIGYLPQDVTLFEGTIAENICRLEEEPDSRAIIAAAKAADVHDMILHLPVGYETNVGPDGSALSAGQRQRVALARALFGDPFLVVLDEPNSNLDAEGECALSAAIQGVRDRGGIVLVIAHRPSALNSVDHVAMINAGRLSAFGPKDEVLKKVLVHPVRTAVS
ncbi:type I secretion system permease/ATPase [Bradyrhizobium sp. 2S1]|uniref:type I secretion system permease/ATPase n=1 Tax=Bradyrhizobium sp. 2S1 TaxID=1404429 RepID=UPI001409D3D4|nr:type I secretion system permease/ATPase [Bradyrhizobium sp. 2S1]MCK7667453.1 type I secretion system permease/ATPase [Bradyrhizobium sp. 2S1]